jgi:hypothetical protein
MSFVVMDYTTLYFTAVAGTSVPEEVTGKFIQVRSGPTTYVVFSPKAYTKYHAHVLERFCQDKGLEGAWDTAGERFTVTDRAWEVLGGGKFDLDTKRRMLRLYGDSMAYGRFDERGLRDALASLPGLAGYAIIIE